MYPHDYVEQSGRQVWQTDLLRVSRLLGHCGWKGFLKLGRGIIFCHVDPVVNQQTEFWQHPWLVRFKLFAPSSNCPARLQDYRLGPAVLPELLADLTSYSPAQALSLLLTAGTQTEIALIQGRMPPDCYQQGCQNWLEFQLAGRESGAWVTTCCL